MSAKNSLRSNRGLSSKELAIKTKVFAVLPTIADFYGVKSQDILAKTKIKVSQITVPRAIASWVLRNRFNFSYPEIGKVLGRHHTTIMSRCKMIDNLIKSDCDFADKLDVLLHQLETLPLFEIKEDVSITENYKFSVFDVIHNFFNTHSDIQGTILVSIRVINNQKETQDEDY